MRWPRAILLVRVTGLMDVTGSGLGRSSGKGVLRQWLHRRRTSRFLKICSQLSFPKIACRTWKKRKSDDGSNGRFQDRVRTD